MITLFDRKIYDRFTQTRLARAQRLIWIATANIKTTSMLYQGRFVSFADFMAHLAARGVNFRIIHAEIPSKPFLERYEQLDTNGKLSAGVEFLHCIRMHAKMFIIDGETALIGSANLTGAGIGSKSDTRRNFEIGFLCENAAETAPFMSYFDSIWMGAHCAACGRRDLCPAPAA
jgi:phosphatidylserine/phosphatidylglycerophosphate/cardiolipin synthase-like enzyme